MLNAAGVVIGLAGLDEACTLAAALETAVGLSTADELGAEGDMD